MAVLLALLAAFSYGLGDFVGGLGSKRASPWMVALVSQLAGALGIGILSLFVSGSPSAADLAWAALAGSFVGLGTVFLYRGLASGRMGVVSPVSGVGAALVPVLVGLIAGERPSTLIWLGMLVALPGIWLVSRTPVTAATETGGSGLLDGVLAGVGFGGMFAAIGQVDEGAGYLPLVLDQFVGGVVVLVVAMTLRIDWVPRLRAGQSRAVLQGALAGALAGVSAALFLASRHAGYLVVAGVLTSLYPAFTVLLAMTLLGERVHRSQAVGMFLCLLCIALVVAG
jgi:drug/metabolite transporter (DMT)-like permease